MRNRAFKLLIGIPLAVVVLAVAGTFVYINFVKDDPPDRLTLDADADGDEGTTTTSSPGEVREGVDGTWAVAGGSQAGYRVTEVLFGQNAEAVGRTDRVTGEITIEGTAVTHGAFSVEMASVASDEDRRDNQFRGRIMDVAAFPTATFTLDGSLDLGRIPPDGEQVELTATGDLTLRGVTRSVTFPVQAQLADSRIRVAGAVPVRFEDYAIPNPDNQVAAVEEDGELEFLLELERAG